MRKIQNILLVDDDEDYGYLSKLQLEKLGLAKCVKVLTTATDALNFILNNCVGVPSEDCPNVIFIDYRMPEMDGFDFLEKLMQIQGIDKENFHVYLVSSLPEIAGQEQLKKYNIKAVIDKPLSAEKLARIFGDA